MNAPHQLPAPTMADYALVKVLADALVDQASQLGIVVTIERRPVLPPAMGNHVPVVNMWADRRVVG